MRLHKRVVLREKRYGKWWTIYAVKQKVITMIEDVTVLSIKELVIRKAKGLKPRKRQVPLNIALRENEKTRWKGEWAVMKSRNHYPTKPHGRLI